MVLNEKQRKKYRWLLSEDGIAKLTFAKGLLPIIGGQIFLKLLPSSLNDITGIQKPVCFIIGLLAFLLVIFGIGLILYAVFILPLLFKAKNKKFEKKYPVSKNRMSRRKLFRAAEAMNENPDSRMRTEVDGDWIEFSLEIPLCQNLHRNARDYNCAVLDFVRVMGDETQNVYIREVAGNAAVKFFLEQKKTNIETMQKNLCLTEEQIKQIKDMRYKFSMWMSIYSYWLYMEVNATEEEMDTIEDRTRPEFWGTPVTAEELARRPVSLRVALYLARQYYAASGETVLRAWEHPDYWLFYGAKSNEKPCAKNQPVSVSKWTSELKSIFWLSKSSKKLFDEAKEIKSNIITRDDAYTYSEKAKPITQNSPTK